jgi:hypothetical protein
VQHRCQYQNQKSKSRCNLFRIFFSKKRRQSSYQARQEQRLQRSRKEGRDKTLLACIPIQSNPDPQFPRLWSPPTELKQAVNLPTNQTNRAQLTAHDGRTKTSNLSLYSTVLPVSYAQLLPRLSLNYCAALHSHHRRTVSGPSHRLASHLVCNANNVLQSR